MGRKNKLREGQKIKGKTNTYLTRDRKNKTLKGDAKLCGSGSLLDPYSRALWIRISIPNTDPDPDIYVNIG